jgi:probable rRNA maturation factor
VEVVLQNPNRYPEASARRLRSWLTRLAATLAPGAASLGVRFASDRELRRANREFRGKDRSTDVLSFPGDEETFEGSGSVCPVERLAAPPGAHTKERNGAIRSHGPEGEGHHLGDILISVPTARRQAAAAGHDGERELRILLLHGLLHCLGHDHEMDGGTMERLERRLRREWIDAAPPARGAGDA